MNILVLGASQGLGLALAEQLSQDHEICGVARSKSEASFFNHELIFDFTKAKVSELLEQIQDFKPDIIVYSAGGGPYGRYSDKEFKDHLWAYKLNFLFPAELIHSLGVQKYQGSIYCVGSQIAEDFDPLGPSYSASKAALKKLVYNLNDDIFWKQKLFMYSPGYMNTDLLPKNSQVRIDPKVSIACPVDVAKDFKQWVLSSDTQKPYFRNYPS